MWRNARDTYMEDRVLSADPMELVQMLYQAAITSVGDARRHLAERQILHRAQSITKACNVLMELTGALDRERGGDISVRLAELYGYMQRRLVEANLKQSDEPLAEVASLLATLLEGWAGARERTRKAAPAPVATPWMQAASLEPAMAHVSVSWSF
jgi:flagellar protein FliS